MKKAQKLITLLVISIWLGATLFFGVLASDLEKAVSSFVLLGYLTWFWFYLVASNPHLEQ